MGLKLFATATSRSFAGRLAAGLGVGLLDVEHKVFPDGESYLRLPLAEPFDLLNHDVVIVGSTECQSALDELYRLGVTAVKHGARILVLVVPYFAYSTMERAVRPGEVVTAKVIARQLSTIPRARRGNWVLLMDLHSAGIVHYFEGDTVALELHAQPRLLDAVAALGLPSVCVASTDMGRAKWVESFANKLDAPVALIHKKRLSGSDTKVAAVVGDVAGRDVVLFDDMIRTGGSLLQAAEAYLQGGARSVQAATTHLVLPPGAVEKLDASRLRAVVGTDTHPRHEALAGRPKFQVVSVTKLFADVVANLVA